MKQPVTSPALCPQWMACHSLRELCRDLDSRACDVIATRPFKRPEPADPKGRASKDGFLVSGDRAPLEGSVSQVSLSKCASMQFF